MNCAEKLLEQTFIDFQMTVKTFVRITIVIVTFYMRFYPLHHFSIY